MAKISGSRNILINLGIIIFFIILAYAYMSPLLEGKVLQMPDIEHHKGMSKELADYRNETGDEAVWTDSMFGGMPGYLISVVYPGNLSKYVAGNIRKMFTTASFLILYMLGFYTLLLSLRMNRWLSLVGAVAFGFSSYLLIIIGAGHMSKANAIAWMVPTIAGVLLTFRGKYLGGALLFSFAFSLELLSGHLQITYYGFLMLVIYVIIQLIYAVKEKALSKYFKAVLFLAAGAIIAVGMNFSRLYTTWEYSKHTIRSPSELTSNKTNQTSGLDKDYVVQWSEGIDETLTLLIPNFMGGSTSTSAPADGKTFQLLRQNNVKNPRNVVKSVIMYHGDKPATAGPYYFGAIVLFLFILGLFVVKGPIKWWLLSATIISIVLSWGKYVMGLTSFLLDYLPLYNKFRAPEMTLVIAEVAMPLLAFWALNDIISGKVDKKDFKKGFTWAFALTGGLSFLFFIAPGLAGNFSAPFDSNYYPEWLTPGIIADRKAMLKTDALRTLIFVALSAGLLYFWNLKKVNKSVLIAGLGFLILIDLWTVDKRYLNNNNFVSKRQAENPFPIMPVDKAILKDKDISYRVLPLQNPFQDARTSYYHKNVGGYHAAKMRRYNEFIEHELVPEMSLMIQGLKASSPPDSIFAPLSGINMMNTKYIIYDLNSAPLLNPEALGNAWFVNGFQLVNNADEEIVALKDFSPAAEAIIDKRFAQFVEGKTFHKDSSGYIKMNQYEPNYLKYTAKASSEQLAVFSEVYYDKGWEAFIDGKQVPHFRVNYVLRALVMPAGEHTIEFKFKPKSYYTGNKISLASSLLLILAIIGYSFSEYKKWRRKE